MTTPSRGDVVLVAFPFVERDAARFRPALVVSHSPIGPESLLWVLMVTDDQNPSWSSDIPIGADYADFGLHIPSVIRASKISTVDARKARVVGRLPAPILARVDAALRHTLAL